MSSCVLTVMEISEQLYVVLGKAAQHLEQGWSVVGCSLAFLPDVALHGMPHSWGTVELIKHPQRDAYEVAVGIGQNMLRKGLASFLRERSSFTADEETLPLVAPLVDNLPRTSIASLLLMLPSHSSLWDARRRWIKEVTTSGEGSLSSLLLQEVLLTSLLLSFHHKMQEVWVYRWWVVERLLQLPGVDVESFNRHDWAVVVEAADKHSMNYNAWNYRRQVCDRLVGNKCGVGEREAWAKVSYFLQQEIDAALYFLETHNGDTSAAAYLVFLLYKVEDTDKQRDTSEYGAGGGPRVASLAYGVWRSLLSATARELRRHWDKGHEAIWVLRLALIHWALRVRPMCGWSLQDEISFVTTYMEAPKVNVGPMGSGEVLWVEASGCPLWTSFYAARYGVQLLKLLSRS